MDKYICQACGYEYDPAVGDPDNGIDPGTPFEDLPEDWVCPVCGVGKDMFAKEYSCAISALRLEAVQIALSSRLIVVWL